MVSQGKVQGRTDLCIADENAQTSEQRFRRAYIFHNIAGIISCEVSHFAVNIALHLGLLVNC